MPRPLFSVKHVATEALLPQKLTIGRAYFVADEQIIIIDHGDGRGPVRYGGRPGPQGEPGEPIPSLQGQIDELAAASMQTTINLHQLNTRNKADLTHLQNLIEDNLEIIKSASADNANALMNLLVVVNKKFTDYDNAINILVHTLSNLYPYSHTGTSGDGSNATPTGIMTTEDGLNYKIEESYIDGDTGVVVVTLYNRIDTLKEGDIVNIDSGYFTVNNIDTGQGVITVTLYEA